MPNRTEQTPATPRVRRASGAEEDCRSAAELLDRFNREFGTPTPGSDFLVGHLPGLLADDTAVLLARDPGTEGSGPSGDDGIALLRFRPSLWSPSLEAYLAEFYVVPESRRRGLGTELMQALLALSRERGCDTVELGTDEGDVDAHRLYRRFGFSNFVHDGPAAERRERMFFYEREL